METHIRHPFFDVLLVIAFRLSLKSGRAPTVRNTVLCTVNRKHQFPSRAPSPFPNIGTESPRLKSKNFTRQCPAWDRTRASSIRSHKSENSIQTIGVLIPTRDPNLQSTESSDMRPNKATPQMATTYVSPRQKPGSDPSHQRLLEILQQAQHSDPGNWNPARASCVASIPARHWVERYRYCCCPFIASDGCTARSPNHSQVVREQALISSYSIHGAIWTSSFLGSPP